MKKSPLAEKRKMGLKLFDEPDQYGKGPNAKGAGKKPQVPRFMKKTGECNIRQVRKMTGKVGKGKFLGFEREI